MNSLHTLMACTSNHLEKELDMFLKSTVSNGSIKNPNNFLAFIKEQITSNLENIKVPLYKINGTITFQFWSSNFTKKRNRNTKG